MLKNLLILTSVGTGLAICAMGLLGVRQSEYAKAIDGMDSSVVGLPQIASGALGSKVDLPAHDVRGRKLPKSGTLVTLTSCTSCTLKSLDLGKLRSLPGHPVIVVFTEPASTVLPWLRTDSVLAVHDPKRQFVSELLYLGAPRAVTMHESRIREIDAGTDDLNSWIERRQK